MAGPSVSTTSAADNRQVGTDQARVSKGNQNIELSGKNAKGASGSGSTYQESGAVQNKGQLNTGTQIKAGDINTGLKLDGNKGNIVIGDPNAADKVSQTATDLSKAFSDTAASLVNGSVAQSVNAATANTDLIKSILKANTDTSTASTAALAPAAAPSQMPSPAVWHSWRSRQTPTVLLRGR